MRYLLDTSSIVTPFHDGKLNSLRVGMNHASLSETEGFLWNWFSNAFGTQCLVGCDELFVEVSKKDDAAKRLMNQLREEGCIMTLSPEPKTFAYLEDITRFVQAHFEAHQADEFLKGNDPMLIALAKTHEVGIVTEERLPIPEYDSKAGKIKGKVPLPYVAWAFGVPCVPLSYVLLVLPEQIAEVEEASAG